MWKYLAIAIMGSLIFSTLARAEPKLDVRLPSCALNGMELDGKPWSMELLSNGLEVYMFDLNNDGLSDVELLVPQGDPNRVPLFYWLNDSHGEALYTLKDSVRDGSCHDIKIVWHKYQPNWRKGA